MDGSINPRWLELSFAASGHAMANFSDRNSDNFLVAPWSAPAAARSTATATTAATAAKTA
jgi:alkanesulfonate monooxygenase SsuD/methylene tetrahydromethanopterin reductase-like flavin-dependent oxidoreductase (luciferase family)